MPQITTLFWDVGGVLGSNGWDHTQRKNAADKFALDNNDFESKHAQAIEDLEIGNINLSEYLRKVIFDRPRNFSEEDFCKYMHSLSKPNIESISLAKEISKSKRFTMATVNNEGNDLNLYRIEKFELRDAFTEFLSSCYLGVRKPAGAIYQRAVNILQKQPAECVMIDDRQNNLDSAKQLGLQTILFKDAASLTKELKLLGVNSP